jgi:hypothetical protein
LDLGPVESDPHSMNHKTHLLDSHVYELDSFLSVLTPRIQADLPTWYGNEAKLVGLPKFFSRDWSFIIRYLVQVSDTDVNAILVKIKHTENMSLSEAIVSEKMGQEAKDEYETLVKIQIIFSRGGNSYLFLAIPPLALYEDVNALVTEEVKIRPLKSLFQSPRMFVEGEARRTFEEYVKLTGRWLRIFHDQIGGVEDGILFPESLYQIAQGNLEKIQSHSKHRGLSDIRDLVSNLYNRYDNVTVPYHFLHEDFHLANVFVSDDGRICSFDPHNRPGSLYLDLAKFITDLATTRTQVLTNGFMVPPPRLKIYNEVLLLGYFEADYIDHFALNLYRLLTLIQKWEENEIRLERSAGLRRFLYLLAAPQMRGYFQRFLDKLVYEQFRGF